MTEQVVIERMSYGAQGIGRLSSGKTVFVDGAVPQDTVSVVIDQEKSSFARGHVDQVLEASPLRVPCTCPHGAVCGGCPWQALSYQAQHDAKGENVRSALIRTAGMDPEAVGQLVRPVAGSKRQWGYRNKLELACFSDDRGRLQLGFHAQGGNPSPAPDTCPVAVKALQKAPKALRGSLRFAQGADDLGIFRVGVRSSLRTHSTEVALWTPAGAFPRVSVAKTLQSACSPTSVVRVLADPGKARKVKKVEVLSGKGFWAEELCGTRFMTSAPAFFQVNTAQAERLVAEVMRGIAGRSPEPFEGGAAAYVDQVVEGFALEDLRECVSGTESAEEAAIRKEILASLNRFLGTLKEAERSVFLCRYWYLDSTEEIAEKSGFTVSKVKSMLFRIRKRLYAQLTEEGLV